MEYSYEGFYTRFDTASAEDGGILAGADTLVGDVFTVDFRVDSYGATTAWLVNRFGGDLGFLNAADTYRLQVATARGLVVRALLSFVAYTENQEPSPFWGEVAIVCTPSSEPLFDAFVEGLSKTMAEGVRPDVNLGEPELRKLVEADGSWVPSGRIPYPAKKPGTALVKSRRSFSENMVEEGRKGNVGCYAVSIVSLIAIVAGIVYLVGSSLGFF